MAGRCWAGVPNVSRSSWFSWAVTASTLSVVARRASSAPTMGPPPLISAVRSSRRLSVWSMAAVKRSSMACMCTMRVFTSMVRFTSPDRRAARSAGSASARSGPRATRARSVAARADLRRVVMSPPSSWLAWAEEMPRARACSSASIETRSDRTADRACTSRLSRSTSCSIARAWSAVSRRVMVSDEATRTSPISGTRPRMTRRAVMPSPVGRRARSPPVLCAASRRMVSPHPRDSGRPSGSTLIGATVAERPAPRSGRSPHATNARLGWSAPGAHRPGAHGPRVAGVHPRVREIPAIARRAAAHAPRTTQPFRG